MDVRIGFQVAPGKCFTCSAHDGQLPVIDTGFEHPGVVRRFNVYICRDCVLAMVKMLEPHIAERVVSVETLDTMMATTVLSESYRERAEAAESKLAGLAALFATSSAGSE
jgi:hypothetical protein